MAQHHYHCGIKQWNYTKADGSARLVLYVSINRKVDFFTTGFAVLPACFNPKTGRVHIPGKEGLSADINMVLSKLEAKANDIFIRHRLQDVQLTKRGFKSEFLQKDLQGDFLLFMEKLIPEIAPDMSKATVSKYYTSLRMMRAYSAQWFYHGLTPEFINGFDRWLRKRKCAANTLYRYHWIIRKFLHEAQKRNIYIPPDLYRDIKMQRLVGNRVALSKQELQTLVTLYKNNLLPDHLQRTLGQYLWCCIAGGMRFGDMASITDAEIINNTLVFTPTKLKRYGRRVVIPLSPFAMEFLQNKNGPLFRAISNQKTNVNLKQIARIAGITKNITFHTSRHTFATIQIELGTDPATIMDCMGISKWQTFKTYLHISNSHKQAAIDRFSVLTES